MRGSKVQEEVCARRESLYEQTWARKGAQAQVEVCARRESLCEEEEVCKEGCSCNKIRNEADV